MERFVRVYILPNFAQSFYRDLHKNTETLRHPEDATPLLATMVKGPSMAQKEKQSSVMEDVKKGIGKAVGRISNALRAGTKVSQERKRLSTLDLLMII